MLITVKNTCSNYVVYDYIVLLIIYIEPRGIIARSFYGFAELVNKKIIKTVRFSKAPPSSNIMCLHGCF